MNPMMMLIQAARGGGNPMDILSSMSGNPMIAQGMKLIQGKSPEQLEQLARNMAKERGTTPEQIIEQITRGMQ